MQFSGEYSLFYTDRSFQTEQEYIHVEIGTQKWGSNASGCYIGGPGFINIRNVRNAPSAFISLKTKMGFLPLRFAIALDPDVTRNQ